eukprot:scpid90650/ scgid29825/ 
MKFEWRTDWATRHIRIMERIQRSWCSHDNNQQEVAPDTCGGALSAADILTDSQPFTNITQEAQQVTQLLVRRSLCLAQNAYIHNRGEITMSALNGNESNVEYFSSRHQSASMSSANHHVMYVSATIRVSKRTHHRTVSKNDVA